MSISLRTRIAVTVVILIAIVVVVTLAVAYHEMVEAMYYAIDQIVLRDAEVVQSEFGQNHVGSTDNTQVLTEITKVLSGPDQIRSPLYRIWIEGESTDLLSSDLTTTEKYLALTDVPLPNRNYKKKYSITTIIAAGREYRALAMLVALPGSTRMLNAVVAAPCDYAIHEIEEFRHFMLIFGGIVILVAGIVAALLVHGAMRPVGMLAKRLQDVTHHNLSDSSVDITSIPSDLRPFAESVGTMLGRLHKAFDQQKRFTADAAHELRSPLAVAKSTIQSTLSMPEQERDYIEMAMSEQEDLNRMEHLIEQLLVLARLENNTSIAKDNINLQSILEESVSQFADVSPDISVVLDEPVPQVGIRGYRSELLRLLSNLIDNALRHGPAYGTVYIKAQHCGQQQIQITIHDEGGNIPPESIGLLTERFYRVDSSRTRATGGTGLGLSIASEIAQRHGGEIKIESSPENGTSVHVTLGIL